MPVPCVIGTMALDTRFQVRCDRRCSGTMKTIYLHIGHYKTGSSAIQAYLSRHADDLRAVGYLYPGICRPRNNPTNHGQLALTLARDHGFYPPPWYRDEISTDAAFASLDAALRDVPEPNVILSSEEFAQLALRADSAAAMDDLTRRLAGHDVRVIFYLREPLSLLKSWFNEVNKGVVTRTFPAFFAGLNGGFISQRPIIEAFQRAFGPDKVTVLAYRHTGAEHVAGFLRAVGCAHPPGDDAASMVNPAQTLADLETTRIGKASDNYDRATLSGIEDIARYIHRTNEIRANYDKVTHLADAAIPGKLTAQAVFSHYRTLLTAAGDAIPLNPAEGDQMRNLALAMEGKDLTLAKVLMDIAALIRPEAPFIRAKVAEYGERLPDAQAV
ncbi:hypothetical protein [Falsirhodobacter halotolerans]|uniref:hypothetical protein n=1 Tax=Falsirhodobacter halotolerans TaxID=1146892 RepID=UPI001FD21C93|nr:hypothetical protein [Falsirhodobacter halotolerans]MCJ8138311.1 hypothetical protein [Falsirhodobacter halotolerans]